MLRYKHVSTISNGQLNPANTTTLWTVNVNKGAPAAVLTIYDGASAAGTVVAVIDASAVAPFAYGVICPGGIFYDLAGGAADITIGYV